MLPAGKDKIKDFPVVITSYEIIIADSKFLQKYPWTYIAVDEGHRLKNFNCRLLRELRCFSASNKLLLSGGVNLGHTAHGLSWVAAHTGLNARYSIARKADMGSHLLASRPALFLVLGACCALGSSQRLDRLCLQCKLPCFRASISCRHVCARTSQGLLTAQMGIGTLTGMLHISSSCDACNKMLFPGLLIIIRALHVSVADHKHTGCCCRQQCRAQNLTRLEHAPQAASTDRLSRSNHYLCLQALPCRTT